MSWNQPTHCNQCHKHLCHQQHTVSSLPHEPPYCPKADGQKGFVLFSFSTKWTFRRQNNAPFWQTGKNDTSSQHATTTDDSWSWQQTTMLIGLMSANEFRDDIYIQQSAQMESCMFLFFFLFFLNPPTVLLMFNRWPKCKTIQFNTSAQIKPLSITFF